MLKLQTGIITTLKRVSDSFKTADGAIVPVVDGIGSLSEVVSPNGYRYRKTFWGTVMSQQYFKDAIANRTSLGCIEHPEDDDEYLRTPYKKASHVVIDAVLKDNNPHCKFALLNNDEGNSIKALVDINVPVGVSTRGLGETLQDDISPYIDENNYAWITWDIVNNPNFSNLRMQLISDSLKAHPIFKELVHGYRLKDSGSLQFSREALLSEMERMKDSLQKLTQLLGFVNNSNFPTEDGATFVIKDQRISKDLFRSTHFNSLQFENCVIDSLPDNLHVDNILNFIACSGKLTTPITCRVLDIRGCNGITELPKYLITDELWAQGSGITALPKDLNCKVVNLVNTGVTTVPTGNIITELRASDSVKVEGFVKNLIKF